MIGTTTPTIEQKLFAIDTRINHLFCCSMIDLSLNFSTCTGCHAGGGVAGTTTVGTTMIIGFPCLCRFHTEELTTVSTVRV